MFLRKPVLPLKTRSALPVLFIQNGFWQPESRDRVMPTRIAGFSRTCEIPPCSVVEGAFMSTLHELVKDRKLFSVESTRTVLEAARYMMEHNVGAMPVLRNGDLAGILSERDIMNRVVAVGRNPGTTVVSEVMTANPRAVPVDETIEECLFIMREFGFRHLPIVEGKQVKGIVSLRDVLLHHAAEMERQVRQAAS
jgi:CBS domain-containing protein